MATAGPTSDRRFFVFNAVVSTAALALLAWLLLIRRGADGGLDLSFMPAINAGWNALSTVLLISAYVAIKQRKIDVHRHLMVAAFVSSSLFLVGYVAYHYVHGDTHYEGAFRTPYLIILASHVLLSVAVVPMALSAFYFAWKKRFSTHKKITKILWPIWVYVSITGVVIWYMLHV